MAKPLRKAQEKLQARITDYERTISGSKVSASAFTKPGSMKKP